MSSCLGGVASHCTNVSSELNVKSPTDSVTSIAEVTAHASMPQSKSVHDTIPKKCKERSFMWSMYFLMRDIALLASVVGVMHYVILPLTAPLPTVLRVAVWILYAIVQGTIATGPWVVGHECGHGAFSTSQVANDCVGYITHSALLVPYWSWAYSHAKHHKFTNHTIWDETHVPQTRDGKAVSLAIGKVLGEDAFAINELICHLVFGWPAYLIANATGGRVNHEGEPIDVTSGRASHFFGAGSEVFPPHMHTKVNASGIGVLLALCGLVAWGWSRGFTEVCCWYLGPYLIVNFWLVLYTWLQHTHADVPHYGSDAFTWLRGALCTIDRPYPWIVDELHHHIGSTHVVHHIDHKIPHYHAVEATIAMREFLGDAYRYDPTGIIKATWEVSKQCAWIDGLEGIQYYKGCKDAALQQKGGKDGGMKKTKSN